MPIYEYRCRSCVRKSSVLVRTFSPPERIQCSHCGSHETERLISTFVTLKSEDSRLADLSDPSSFADVDEKDPKSMARWLRRMEHALGEDLGEDFQEMTEMVEAGQSPMAGEEAHEEDEHEGHDDGEAGEEP